MIEDLKNWTKREVPDISEIVGKACVLCKINFDEDFLSIQEEVLHTSEVDWEYLSAHKPENQQEFEHWFEDKVRKSEFTYYYLIKSLDRKQILGMLSYLRVDPDNGTIEIGNILFFDKIKRTIAGTEAIYLMISHAIDQLGYRRCEWKCDAKNSRSISAAIRYGFNFEGVFSKAIVYKNRSRDTAWFSITNDRWASSIKERFQKWLAPSNFDGNGMQIKKLSEI